MRGIERGGGRLACLWERGLDWLYPQRCWFCGQAAAPGPFCADHALPGRPRGPRCDWCAGPLPRSVPDGERCSRCRQAARRAPRATVLGDYALDRGLRDQILALKHAGRRDLAAPLGAALGDRWLDVRGRLLGPDGGAYDDVRGPLLVPIPLHPLRRFERGYDQAALLAAAVAERIDGRCERLLRRARATAPQGTPGVASRRANVDGAFLLGRGADRPRGAGERLVVLVDDVVTSGATAASAARTLRSAGFDVLGVLALARAGPKRANGARAVEPPTVEGGEWPTGEEA